MTAPPNRNLLAPTTRHLIALAGAAALAAPLAAPGLARGQAKWKAEP